MTIYAKAGFHNDVDARLLTAEVDGEYLVFEGQQVLTPRHEALLSMLLISTMKAGVELQLDRQTTVDGLWKANAEKAMQKSAQWWQLNHYELMIESGMSEIPSEGKRGVGLFFTGGVDSAYSLCVNRGKVTHLINVQGLDIPLNDHQRQEQTNELLAQIAERESLELLQVRTNIRDMRLFNAAPWSITHGGVLGGIAHLFSRSLETVLIASSNVPGPYGSHPELDPLWSSSALNVVYDTPGVKRLDKVRRIAKEPYLVDLLKVCWENRATDLNCGICEKCVRTQCELAAAGVEAPASFPKGNLVARVDDLAEFKPHFKEQWNDIQRSVSSDELQNAIARLSQRSLAAGGQSRVQRLYRKTKAILASRADKMSTL
ncbi:MAG: hypothetical protein AAF662_16250 [Pseudomonadota bacterium]